MLRRRVPMGNKVQVTVTLRQDLVDYIDQMMMRAGGWTRTGVIEFCIERCREMEGSTEKRTNRVMETLARIEEGVNRLRAFHDYELWERFETEPRESYEEWLKAMEERAQA